MLIEAVVELAKTLAKKADIGQEVIITGIGFKDGDEDKIMTLAWTNDTYHTYISPRFPKQFSGTGDIFSSTMCGLRMNGYSTEESLRIASDFIYNSIVDTIPLDTDGNDGIHFEKHLGELIKHVR